MKRILALALLVFSGLCFAQTPAPITTSQVNLPFTALVPVSTANVALVGNPGQQTYYYWIVANYTVGSTSPSGPFMAGNAPATLSVTNYVTITPIYPAGVSLDLLRTTSPIPPSGACNCAVETAVTGGAIADQSNSLSAYFVAPGFIASNYALSLDNEAQGYGLTHLILRQDGSFVADLSIGSGPGGGNVVGPGSAVVNDLGCWGNTGGTLLIDCGVGLPLPNSSLQNSAVTINATPVSLGGSVTITAAPSGAATGDLGGTYPGPTVKGVNGVPLCTGFTPTTGQALEYTTASSPNPCYTAATITPSLSNPMTTLGDFLYGGVTGTPTRLPGATTPNGVPEVLVSIPSGGLATPPALALPGIPGRSVTGTSDTIVSTDCNPKRIAYTGSSPVAVTLPTPTTLGVPSCTTKLVNNTSSTVTITPTTWTISSGSGSPAATLVLTAGQTAVLFVDPTTANNWAADVPGGSSGSLPSGSFGEPLVNASGSTAYSTSALFIDASQESGATLDVKLNNANARAITNKVPKVEASSLNGTQTLAAQANIGQLSAPVFTSTPNAGPYANGTYRGAYTLTSPVVTGETSASAESTFTISGCGSGCQINMATPTYFGTATSYSPYLTVSGGGSWTEDKCAGNANTAIGTNAAIVAACSGAAVSTSNQGFPVHLVLPAQGVWNVSITDGTSCGLKFFDQSSSRGVESGEGRPFFVGATSSATSVDSLICTDNNAKNNKGYYKLEGLAAEDIAGDNIATGVLTFRNTFDVSVLSYPHVGTHSNAVGLALVGNCCSSTVVSPQVEGAGVGQPLAIGAAGSTSGNELSLLIIGGSFVHSGAGNPNIVIAGAIGGTAAGSIDFSGTTYMECSVTNTVDLIQVGSQGNVVGPIHFDDVRIGGGTCGGTNAGGQYIFDVGLGSNTVGHFSVDRTFNGAMTNLFRYPGNTALNINGLSANTTYPNVILDNNNPVTILSSLSVGGAMILTPTTFSNLVTCNSGNAGRIRPISDSNTQTWGATVSTGGGALYAIVTCDGTNWTVMGK